MDKEAKKTQIILGNVPSKSNCYRIVVITPKNKPPRATLAKTAELRKYEKDFAYQCKHYRNAKINGEFELYLDVYYSSKRPDLDNSFKVILDCLQDVKAIGNDNKCILIFARKLKDQRNPRVEFTIVPVNTQLDFTEKIKPKGYEPKYF